MHKLSVLLLCLQCLNSYEKTVHTDSCNDTILGADKPQDFSQNVDNDQGEGVLIDGLTFGCCAFLSKWEFWADKETGEVRLQVWRPSGTTWSLLGENVYDAQDKKTSVVYPVQDSERMLVQSGDAIGFFSPGKSVVGYGKDTGGQSYRQSTAPELGNFSIGSTFGWESVSFAADRQFSIRADLTESIPTISSATVTFPDTTPIGTVIGTITASDNDVGDVVTVTMTSLSTVFAFNSSSFQMRNIALMTSGSTNITLQVSDLCGKTQTGSLVVVVTNTPPKILNLPFNVDVSEDQTEELLLHVINVTDDSPSDTVTCDVTSVTPLTNIFFTKIAQGTYYGIYIRAQPSLSYITINEYTMAISCDDTKDTVTSTFRVYILKNSAPVFTNLQASVSVSNSATMGTNVYTVTSYDAENDQLFYNMSCSPVDCPFTIFESGDVQVSSDLHGVNVSGYDLYIYVYDGITLVGPKTLSIIFPTLNSAPVIINLPLMSDVIVPENAPLGSSVFQVSYTDRNIGDTHVITASMTPTSGSNLFSMNTSSGLISTSQTININYEMLSVTSYLIQVTVYDGIAYTTSSLTVTIADVNEAPSFSKNLYYASGDEGLAGASFGTPSFVVSDPDAISTHTYSIGCPEFDIERNTGELFLAIDYDIDKSTNPSSVTCVVTVSDGDLSGTASVAITINDVNDNAPVFSLPSYTFYVAQNSAVGTQLGSISATDRDIGQYGEITYELDHTALGTEYFSVDSIGGLYVRQSLAAFSVGQVLSLNATTTDTGGLTGSAAISIVIIEATTVAVTTATPDRHIQFLEDPRNVAWLSVSCVLFGGLGLLIVYLVVRYGSLAAVKKWCTRSRPLKTQPFREAERKKSAKQTCTTSIQMI